MSKAVRLLRSNGSEILMANQNPNLKIARADLNGKIHSHEKPGKLRLQFEWESAISDEQWECYCRAIIALRDAGIRFLLGGGFALAVYTGRCRNTKDIDFYISEKDRAAAVKALTEAGFEDYFSTLRYDRKWIYRSTCSGVIVDIIWAMANQRARVDEIWFQHAPLIRVRNEPLYLVPLEEFFWCKLYIIQRDHCDWTDILNLLYATGGQLDWDHLLDRMGDDWPLLKGLLSVYGWLCPKQALELPKKLQRKLRLDKPAVAARCKYNRVRLLDTRRWFAAILPKDQPLEV
jgi:hypothetical protein